MKEKSTCEHTLNHFGGNAIFIEVDKFGFVMTCVLDKGYILISEVSERF